MSGRCLLIGLDGGTFSLLDPLMSTGTMPFLDSLVAGGARGSLRSVTPPCTPPAWTSISTGRSPAHHGVLDFLTFESPTSYFPRLTNASDVRCETLWSMVTRFGSGANVLNFPVTAPPRPIAGAVVPGWVPSRFLRLWCHPRELFAQLKTEAGVDVGVLGIAVPRGLEALEDGAVDDLEGWVGEYTWRERQWARTLTFLNQREPRDLTAIVFDGPDKLQHRLWYLLDPSCRLEGLSASERSVRESCLEYYRVLDGLIGEIVGQFDEQVTVFIVSDHGFGPSRATFNVNAWLHAAGYLKWADAVAEPTSTSSGLKDSLWWMHRMIDWSGTSAFALTPSSHGIHLCLAGQRSPHGVSAEEYGPLRNRIASELRSLIDPITGQLLVEAVLTREQAFPGPCAIDAPDLTILLREGAWMLTSQTDEIVTQRPHVVGSHRYEGIFIAHGPGIEAGAELADMSVMDVAPTLLYALNLPIPEDLEGRVAWEAFKPAIKASQPMITGGPSVPPEPLTAAPTSGQPEVIARLRALGYLE